MKKLALFLLFMAPLGAQAQLLVQKGARVRLDVEYTFASAGRYESSSKDQTRVWDSRKTVTMSAIYSADAPQAFGALHADDPEQKKSVADLRSATAKAATKMAPTMNDMMKLMDECGGADTPQQQACIEKKVAEYANTNRDSLNATRKSVQGDAAALSKAATDKRFQLWNLVSQSGQYQFSEQVTSQVFEMTCTKTKKCERIVVRKGGGAIPPPPGGKSPAGSSMFEVDSTAKNAVIRLPMPLAPLQVEQTVTTTIPDETGGKSTVPVPPWMAKAVTPITVPVPTDLASASGTKTLNVAGSYEEGGKLTITWKFTAL